VLLDDDLEPDQIEGKPGPYVMTARGWTEPPWAVVHPLLRILEYRLLRLAYRDAGSRRAVASA
jgi:hypothetical protein